MQLESCRLFAGLAPAEVAVLAAAAVERRFPAGAEIFREGDQGDGLYCIRSGRVGLAASVAPGERRTLSFLGPGDSFGEMAILDGLPRSATARADTDAVVWFVPRDAVVAQFQRSPELCLAVVRDTTRRLREANRHFIQALREHERLSAVGRFASGIVHDLKNPLGIIAMAADLGCQEQADQEMRRQSRTRVRQQVERIREMVGEVLEFSRSPAAGLHLVPVDFSWFVRAHLEELVQELAERDVRVSWLTPPPRARVAMDPARLVRVWRNLLNNSAEAMPRGGTVTLRAEVSAGRLRIEIGDTGPGLPAAVLDHLFEPFTTHGKPHGTGLGLCLARRIVEEHGGSLTGRNAPGGGALFELSLPVVADDPRLPV